MKVFYKISLCVAILFAMQTLVSAQIGYSVSDNNRDATGLAQQYYSIDLATGQGTLIQTLANSQGNPVTRREYEGLASIGTVLFGISEFDTELCNTGSDPITGLASDLRIFTTRGIGPQVGETCIDFGGEAGSAYNQQDGFIYTIASDDELPATAPRSRLYRVSPTTGLATLVNPVTLTANSPAGGDENTYLDGLAILPNGVAYATEARFGATSTGNRGTLYRIFLSGANAGRVSFIKRLLASPDAEDTGLASLPNGQLVLLLEDSQVFFGNPNDAAPFAAPAYGRFTTPGCLITPICQDFEGFDIPNGGNGIR